MRTMTAYQLTAYQQPPAFVEVPVPQPSAGEVLVKVAGVGLCHSDLLFLDSPEGAFPYTLPFTLGHEIAGTVAAVGDGAQSAEVGESVIVYGPWGCGRCFRCSRGEEHLCERRDIANGTAPGIGRDGDRDGEHDARQEAAP
jgi:propanol-preferring alcohol dehydrogenase